MKLFEPKQKREAQRKREIEKALREAGFSRKQAVVAASIAARILQ